MDACLSGWRSIIRSVHFHINETYLGDQRYPIKTNISIIAAWPYNIYPESFPTASRSFNHIFLSPFFSLFPPFPYFPSCHPTKFIGNLYLRSVNYTRRQVLDFSSPRGARPYARPIFHVHALLPVPKILPYHHRLLSSGLYTHSTLLLVLALQGATEPRVRCVQVGNGIFAVYLAPLDSIRRFSTHENQQQ